jgi:hypothetical protein
MLCLVVASLALVALISALAVYDDNLLFCCNHYKWKSKEEYDKRAHVFNSSGYMMGKLTGDAFRRSERDNGRARNYDILRYVSGLREQMMQPLEPVAADGTHFLAILVVFRFEDAYLSEWLNYYILHGARHFFMYSNGNSSSTEELLRPYVDAGYVTLTPWEDDELDQVPEASRRRGWSDYTKVSIQNLAYRHFVKNYRRRATWVLKVDVDEFVYPRWGSSGPSIRDVLERVRPGQRHFLIPRRDFGSDGHFTKPTGLVIENYTVCEREPGSFKPLVLAAYLSEDDPGDAHSFRTTHKVDTLKQGCILVLTLCVKLVLRKT